MLKIMRDKELKKKVIWVVAIIIILSFGVFGTAYLVTDMGDSGYAGKIFNKKVSAAEFQKAYRIARVQALMRYGDNFRNVQQYLDLENKAWDRLILKHEAEQRNIKVYNDEIVKTIQGYDFFQKNGQFDTTMYNYLLRSIFKINPREFEEGIRENLQMARIYDQETQSIDVTIEDVREEFIRNNEQVQVSYTIISPDQFKDEKMYDAEKAKEFFENNKRQFVVPSAVNIEYIEFPYAEAEKSSDPASQDDNAAAEAEDPEDAAMNLALELSEKLQENPDLKIVAQENGIDVKETGFFSAENPNLDLGWPYELLTQVFSMPVKQIKGPYETSTGLVILNVLENRDAYIPEYEEVHEDVKDAFLIEQARETTQVKAQEYLEKIKESLSKNSAANFAKIVKGLKLEVQQTPSFNRGQYLPNLGITKEFETAAFELDENNKLSNVIETATGYSILHLDNYTPADESTLTEQEPAIREELLTEQKNAVFNDFISNLRIKADLYDNIAAQQTNQ